jgi:hypothetical protein
MKNSIYLLLGILCIGLPSKAQKTYTFLPNYKVGDQKTLTIHQKTSSTEADVTEVVQEETLEATLRVDREDEDAFYITMNYPDVVFDAAKRAYEKLGKELDEGRTLVLQLKTSKTTGETEIINLDEARSFVTDGIDQIKDLLPDDQRAFSDMIFKPIESIFENDEVAQEYFNNTALFFESIYNYAFTPEVAAIRKDSAANPFDPSQILKVEYTQTLTQLDASTGLATLRSEGEMDMSMFKDMMKKMMEGMFASLDEEQKEKALKEIESIDMTMVYREDIQYNYKTGWPTTVTRTADSNITAPGKQAKTQSVVTVTFK